MFAGYVQLEGTFYGTLLTTENGALTDADAFPTYRIYGPSGIVTGGTGTMAYRQTGVISGIENTTPIRVNMGSAHGLQTGQRLSISGVSGAVAGTVNGQSFPITVVDADTFELQSTTAAGTGTGGSWHLTGQYTMSHAILAANGYDVNETYTVIYAGEIGGEDGAGEDTFAVV